MNGAQDADASHAPGIFLFFWQTGAAGVEYGLKMHLEL